MSRATEIRARMSNPGLPASNTDTTIILYLEIVLKYCTLPRSLLCVMCTLYAVYIVMYKENSCTKVKVFGVHNFEPSPILYHKIYFLKPHKKSGSKVALEMNHLIYSLQRFVPFLLCRCKTGVCGSPGTASAVSSCQHLQYADCQLQDEQ